MVFERRQTGILFPPLLECKKAPSSSFQCPSSTALTVKMVAQIHHPPYPLHASVKDRLHPQYVAFYNKYLQDQQPVHLLPLAVSRGEGKVLPGHSKPLPVGKTEDVSISRRESCGPNVPIRCFTPQGAPPRAGWPLVLYVHGGGWVFGDIGTENTVCTNMCVRARAVVITTDYRLELPCIPPHPQPCPLKSSLWFRVSFAISLTGLS